MQAQADGSRFDGRRRLAEVVGRQAGGVEFVLAAALPQEVEVKVGCQRFDLTTGEVKTVIPTAKNMSNVFGKDGVETEIQVGQMRQTLGKPGFDWLFNNH